MNYKQELDNIREQMKSCTSGMAMNLLIQEEERLLNQVPMNRLESIKELIESLRDVSVDAGADNNKVYIGPRLVATWHDAESLERLEQLLTKDAPHLLQRLERYEKALNALDRALGFDKERTTSHIEAQMKSATTGTVILMLQHEIDHINAINKACKLAKEALKE